MMTDHLVISLGTLSNQMPFQDVQKRSSFFPLFPCFSSISLATKTERVVAVPGLNPNCISSTTTFSMILVSNTRSVTFTPCSSNFIALQEPHSIGSPFSLNTGGQESYLQPLSICQIQSTIPYQDFHLPSSFLTQLL